MPIIFVILVTLFIASFAGYSGPVDICGDNIYIHTDRYSNSPKIVYGNKRGDVFLIRDEFDDWDYKVGNPKCSPNGKYVYFYTLTTFHFPKIEKRDSKTLELIDSVGIDNFESIAVGPDNHVFVISFDSYRITEFSQSLEDLNTWNIPFSLTPEYKGIGSFVIDADGYLYISYRLLNTLDYAIEKFTPDGQSLGIIDVQFTSSRIRVANNLLIVASDDGLFAYDLSTNNVVWVKNNYIENYIAADGDYLVFSDDSSDDIEILNVNTGKLISKWDDRSISPVSPRVKSNGDLMIRDGDRLLVVTPFGKIKKQISFNQELDAFVLSPIKNQMIIQFENEAIIRKYSAKKKLLKSFNIPDNDLDGLIVNNNGDILVIVEPFIRRYSAAGIFLNKVKLVGAKSLAVDSNNKIYTIKDGTSVIRVYSSDLKFEKKIGGTFPLIDPVSLYIDSSNLIYIIDRTNVGVHVYKRSGKHVFSFGQNDLIDPYQLAVTPSDIGVTQFIYVMDDGQVAKFKYNGEFITRWFN